MAAADGRRDAEQVDWLGVMLAECSFACLGWLKMKGGSKANRSDEPGS